VTRFPVEAYTPGHGDPVPRHRRNPPFAFKSGHTDDVAKAIEMHPQAKKLLADKDTMPGLRRTMVKTAIVMGFPVQG